MTDIARERKFLRDQGLVLLTRESWNAVQSYTSARDVFEPVEGFVLHISVTIDGGNTGLTEEDDMRDIERIGQERFGIGFPYNAAVFDTGRMYEGQPLTRRGAHTVDDKNIGYKSTGSGRSMNFWWRAIVLPQMVTDDVTDAQVHGCAKWAAAQIRAGYAKRNAIWIGHRDVAWKSCPGDTGYARLPEIRRLTEHYVVNGLGDDEDMYGWTEDEYKTVQRNIIKQEVPALVEAAVDEKLKAMFVGGYEKAFGEAMQKAVGKTQGTDGAAAAQVRARAQEGALKALETAGLYVPPETP